MKLINENKFNKELKKISLKLRILTIVTMILLSFSGVLIYKSIVKYLQLESKAQTGNYVDFMAFVHYKMDISSAVVTGVICIFLALAISFIINHSSNQKSSYNK